MSASPLPSFNMTKPKGSIEVAIIGGGIIGVTLGVGLLRRGVSFTIYERAQSFREIGAGVGLGANAVRAMESLDPRMQEAFSKVATLTEPLEPYVQYLDGYNQHCASEGEEKLDIRGAEICRTYLGVFNPNVGQACRRSDFLEEIVALIPSQNVRFQKNLVTAVDTDEGKVLLNFEDGTSIEADAVIGCDGIKSRMRSIMLGKDHPASQAGYTHKVCYRGLVPLETIRVLLGDQYKNQARAIHTGPNAHIVAYPIAHGELLNVAAFVHDPSPWSSSRLTTPATRNEVIEAYAGFGPSVQAIISHLPENLDKWGIFDLLENPVPAYHKGSVCLAGDAAHASTPHLGAGAGFGIEDALVLAELLAAINNPESVPSGDKQAAIPTSVRIKTALSVYNEVRYDRTQWLVENSRKNGDMYQWRYGGIENNSRPPEKFAEEINRRLHTIREIDTDAMVQSSLGFLRRRLGSL